MNKFFMLLCLLLVSVSGWCSDALLVETDSSSYVDLEKGGQATIKLFSQEDGVAEVSIFSPDGFLVRSLPKVRLTKNVQKAVVWDGKDNDDVIVPSEAYFPRVQFRLPNSKQVHIDYHPLLSSGGEIMPNIPFVIAKSNQISIRINKPSRILARAGITEGPLLRTLSSWQPYLSGRVDLDWDGRDSSGKIDIANMQNFNVFVTGYALPDGAIMIKSASGTYSNYCKRIKHLPDLRKLRSNYIANYQRLSEIYISGQCLLSDPVPTLDFKISDRGYAHAKVTIPEEYMSLVQQDMYEVAIFINNKFVEEREQGFMPFYWEKDLSHLRKGSRHLVTVNIAGFKGNIGTVSDFFEF